MNRTIEWPDKPRADAVAAREILTVVAILAVAAGLVALMRLL